MHSPHKRLTYFLLYLFQCNISLFFNFIHLDFFCVNFIIFTEFFFYFDLKIALIFLLWPRQLLCSTVFHPERKLSINFKFQFNFPCKLRHQNCEFCQFLSLISSDSRRVDRDLYYSLPFVEFVILILFFFFFCNSICYNRFPAIFNNFSN